MKKPMTLAASALVVAVAFAQEQFEDSVKENASNPAVQEMLAQPDGVSILRNENDGSLQIFARGTADYEFGDARDIRSTTKVAELKAKAALSKYFKEVISVEESATEGEGLLSRTILTKADGEEIMKKTTTRDVIRDVHETLSVRSAAILSGVVTLKTLKIPTEGSKKSGEIQVTLGISTKTLAAAAEAHNMITDSFNARRDIGEKAAMSTGANGKQKSTGSCDSKNNNKPEVRVNNTLF
jgi:hypothetical protein